MGQRTKSQLWLINRFHFRSLWGQIGPHLNPKSFGHILIRNPYEQSSW